MTNTSIGNQKDDNDDNVYHEEGHIKCDHDDGTDDTHSYCVCQQSFLR